MSSRNGSGDVSSSQQLRRSNARKLFACNSLCLPTPCVVIPRKAAGRPEEVARTAKPPAAPLQLKSRRSQQHFLPALSVISAAPWHRIREVSAHKGIAALRTARLGLRPSRAQLGCASGHHDENDRASNVVPQSGIRLVTGHESGSISPHSRTCGDDGVANRPMPSRNLPHSVSVGFSRYTCSRLGHEVSFYHFQRGTQS